MSLLTSKLTECLQLTPIVMVTEMQCGRGQPPHFLRTVSANKLRIMVIWGISPQCACEVPQ
jgi:hypothetical protein